MSVETEARQFVEEQLEGEGKDPKAATKILRKRVENRVDPMSTAIRAELDRRAHRHDPSSISDWPGWEL